MALESLKKFNISLTSNDGKRLLVFEAASANSDISLIDYQLKMLSHNPQGYIIPAEILRLDNTVSIAFNVSTLIPISELLKNKISINIIWNTLYEMVTNIIDSRKLLLFERNFVLDEEFIYIDGSNKIKLLYLPVATKEEQPNEYLENFILRFLSRVTHIIPEGDECFRRTTALVKSDNFNLDTLHGLLRNYLLQKNQQSNNPLIEPCNVKQSNVSEKDTYDKRSSLLMRTLGVFLLSQVAIAGISVAAERYMDKAGLSQISRYLPIVVFIMCAEYAIYRLFLQTRISAAKEITQVDSGSSTLPNPVKANDSYAANDSQPLPPDIEGKSIALPNNQSSMQSDNHSIDSDKRDLSKSRDSTIFSDETTLLGYTGDLKAWLQHDNEGELLMTELKEGSFLIGRSVDLADMVIPAISVGRIHARIITRDDDFYLIDEDSKNGTFINNIKIDPKREYQLKNDDIITFANMEYTFIK